MEIKVRISLAISATKEGFWQSGKLYHSAFIEMPIDLLDEEKLFQFIKDKIQEIKDELQTTDSK